MFPFSMKRIVGKLVILSLSITGLCLSSSAYRQTKVTVLAYLFSRVFATGASCAGAPQVAPFTLKIRRIGLFSISAAL